MELQRQWLHFTHKERFKLAVRLLSWNVNGLRALLKKPEWDWLKAVDAQIVGLQETKATPDQLPTEVACLPGWHCYWDSSSVKKGYSGVAAFAKIEPLAVKAELPDARYQGEGRLLHLEFADFHFFNVYFPNGGAPELDENGKPTGKFARVPYKLGFYEAFLKHVLAHGKDKPVVVCGDFNIAHRPIDLARPKENASMSGFLPEERAMLDRLIAAGFVDAFRHVHGDEPERYTWWSYQRAARKNNKGWRIDYFFVSRELAPRLIAADILTDVMGSDHCPISITLDT